jgi:NAD(P)-dependent dehydrogenase (short-subunit alcohol dehydrogenase family)
VGLLDGKVALVTGGGSGLGRAIVQRFVDDGARVGVLELSMERADALEKAFDKDQVCVTVGSVTNPNDNQRAVADVKANFGRLDVFVGNAGVYDNRATLAQLPLDKLGPAFDELFGVNVKGYMLGARAALEELRRNRGTILFTASISSYAPGFGGALYITAKHAISGLTKQLALELAPEICVNAIAPGYIPTQLAGLHSLGQGRSTTGPGAERLPLNHVPAPEDYVPFYALLASGQGRIASGAVFPLDHGLAATGPSFRGWEQFGRPKTA